MATDYSMSGEPSVDYSQYFTDAMSGGVSGGADAFYTDPSYTDPTWYQTQPIENNWVDPTMAAWNQPQDYNIQPQPLDYNIQPQPLDYNIQPQPLDYNIQYDPTMDLTAGMAGGVPALVSSKAYGYDPNTDPNYVAGGTPSTNGTGFGVGNANDVLGMNDLGNDAGRVGPGGGRAEVAPLNRQQVAAEQAAKFREDKAKADAQWRMRQAQNRGGQQGGGQQIQPRMQQPQQRAGVGAIPQRAMGGGGIQMPNIARPFAGGAGTGSYRGEGGGSNGGAGSPKPNTSPIKAMLTDYQNAYKEAKKANEDRYADILGGYRESAKALIAKQEALGSNQDEDIKRAYDQQAAMARQNAMSRGIGNTTVTDSLDRGVESDRQRALRAAANDRAAALINLMERAKAAELQFMERRTDSYPSLDTMANLAMQIGRADPNATFDYTPFLSDQTKKA